MRITLVCPAPARSRLGNRVTAVRWQRLLRELGHIVRLSTELHDDAFDVLIAMHARRSAEAITFARACSPARPLVVALTGTDLYRDIHDDPVAKRSIELADALIVLHAFGARAVPRALRKKVHVVPQSAPKVSARARSAGARRTFDVVVVGHLRPEKDPMRTARAARLLPASSRVFVLHAGRALSDAARDEAIAEARDNPRYRWLGEVSTARARRLIARADLLSLTSEMEGGANVLSEAIVAGTAVVASRIDAVRGVLGADYPATFPFGSTRALMRLIARAEAEPDFLEDLRRRCRARRPTVSIAAERAALAAVLRAVTTRRAPR